MSAAAEPLTTDAVHARREERLLRLLERASASSRFNLGERWLFALGGALVVSGFVAVIIGWVGTSRTVLVAGQIPYVVSGGLLGLGLIFLGGFLYFGHWVAVLVRESRERGAEDREDLALVRQGLQEVNRSLVAVAAALSGSTGLVNSAAHPGADPAAPASADPDADAASLMKGTSAPYAFAPGTGASRDSTAPVLLATSTGTMSHRPGCRALVGKPNIRPVSVADGLKPCGMCRPLEHPGRL
jgi:hypothetical protein